MDIHIIHFEIDPSSQRWLADGEADALGESVRWHAWRDDAERRWTVELPRPTGLPMGLLELLLEHLEMFATVREALAEFEAQGDLSIAA
jgi:hypothetical protein